jgi:hypothetical protein
MMDEAWAGLAGAVRQPRPELGTAMADAAHRRLTGLPVGRVA